ncbi:MAG: putative type II secretion system protein F [bacterium]|nr:MAG: putative type II secretion system protein F [bacterium]
MLYSYKGVDKAGKVKKGSLDASGVREARTKLRTEGLFVTDIIAEKVVQKKGSLFPSLTRTIPAKEMTSFMRQMASLLTAGIPLMETLNAAQEQSDSVFLKKVVHGLMDSVRQGEPLADAMSMHKDHFDTLTISMVRAGEAGGQLSQVLTEIADYKEASLLRQNVLKQATTYPIFIAVFGGGVLVFLLAYVVPKITVIFEDLGHALPLSTSILMFITGTLAHYWFWMLLALCAFMLAANKLLKTEKGRRFMDTAAVKAWVIGPVIRSSILARWSHTTAVLLKSGVPLLQTLRLSKDVTQNMLYAEAIESAYNNIREGGGIANSLKRTGLFPPVAIQMVSAGEKSGQSASLLMQVAKDQSAELENRVSVMMSLVPPVLIIVMALAVGFIVMAILLPMLEISQFIG